MAIKHHIIGIASNVDKCYPNLMKYYSPYYGYKELSKIKAQALRDLSVSPGIVDPKIQDVVLAINKLPFVIHTIESCSGHLKCGWGKIPEPLLKIVKYYFANLKGRYLSASQYYRPEIWRQRSHPKYALAFYFFSPQFAKRFLEFEEVPYKTEFKKLEQKKPYWYQDYLQILNDIYWGDFDFSDVVWEEWKIFSKIANFVISLNPPYQEELAALADAIWKEEVGYCDFGYQGDKGIFLEILYVESPEARAFDAKLSQLIKGPSYKIIHRYEYDADILLGMINQDSDATCIACREPLDDCTCWEEGFFDETYDPRKVLEFIKKKQKIQFEVGYWKDFQNPSKQILDNFWDKVRDLVATF